MRSITGDQHLATKLFPGTATAVTDRPDSPASVVSEGSPMAFMIESTIDQDMGRMEGLLDQWTFDLKRNILVSGILSCHILSCLYFYGNINMVTPVLETLLHSVINRADYMAVKTFFKTRFSLK